MLPDLPLLLTVTSNLVIFAFIGLYLLRLRSKEKTLEKKEADIDNNYHHVVDEALSKERKIIDDATIEATQIVKGSQYITKATKEEINRAIKAIVLDIQKEGATISKSFATEYTTSLRKVAAESLSDFSGIMKDLQGELEKDIKDFHSSWLPQIEKELDTYKQARMKEIDTAVEGIIQKASEEIFNKSIPLSDHQDLVIDALEQAKKEGVFE